MRTRWLTLSLWLFPVLLPPSLALGADELPSYIRDLVNSPPAYFGLYDPANAKVGWQSADLKIVRRKGQRVLVESLVRQTREPDGSDLTKTKESVFEMKRPFRLLSFKMNVINGEILERKVEVNYQGDGHYEVELVPVPQGAPPGPLDVNLRDKEATLRTEYPFEVFLSKNPKVGDETNFEMFDFANGIPINGTLRVKERDALVAGAVQTEVLVVSSIVVDPGGRETTEQIHYDPTTGRVLLLKSGFEGAELEQRSEPKRVAMDRKKNRRMILNANATSISSSQDLGHASKVETLTLIVDDKPGLSLDDGPRQTATWNQNNDEWSVKLGVTNETIASEAEIDLNSQATTRFPTNNESIVKTVKRVAGGETNKRIITQNLINEVRNHLREAEINGTLSVEDIVKDPRGRCSEAALYFVTMARAAGIPAREIFGWVYNSRTKQFTGHVWAEVVLNGKWHPVDPHHGQFDVDGTHFAISHTAAQFIQTALSLRGTEFKVKSVTTK